MSSSLLARAAALFVVVASVAACADSTSPGSPTPLPEGPGMVRLECRANVTQRTVSCAPPGTAAGIRADRIMGLGSGITLASSAIAIQADTFAFDLTVSNLLSYPVGTTDGVNPDPNGIRVFVVDGIHTTAGTGAVTVANADGVGVFTAAGQPYFAYHGVLAPDATTPARRWKLRFDPGVEQFTFGLYVSTPVPPGGGRVYMTVAKPTPNSVWGDSVVVRVIIDSASASISSVHATAAGRRVRLLPVQPGQVQALIPLADLPAGPLTLVVDAATVHGDTGTVTVPFIKDTPPRLVLVAPQREYVAGPDLRIDFDCVDDDPAGCASTRATVQTTTVATGTTGIHTSASLSAFNEQVVSFTATGTDSRGQSTSLVRQIYVQSGAAFTPIDSAGAVAVDVDATRLLFTAVDSAVWVHDRPGGTRTQVTPIKMTTTTGFLHPQGAIFTPTSSSQRVYDWRLGTLSDLGAGSNLRAEGAWAVWNQNGGVVRRDLLTGDTVIVSPSASGRADVAANGDVAFSSNTDMYRYRAGVITKISASVNGAYENLYPATDGVNVVWFRTNDSLLRFGDVAFWDGTGETVFSGQIDNDNRLNYDANGGWIARVWKDGGGLTQVRTRAPDGTDRQATTTGSNSQLRALGPDGTVVFANGGSLYVVHAPYSAAPVRLTKDWGRVMFRGTQLLFFLGNSAYSVSY